jgi:hypothetical protein
LFFTYPSTALFGQQWNLVLVFSFVPFI